MDDPATNPLLDPGYLVHPLETILSSCKDDSYSLTLGDLSQAYATLFFRIQTSKVDLWCHEYPPPALLPLKDACTPLIQAVRRDVACARGDPSNHHNIPQFISQHDCLGDKTNLTNASILGDYALRFLSQILQHQALRNILITGAHMDAWLDEILKGSHRRLDSRRS
jgi:hypothetical protein